MSLQFIAGPSGAGKSYYIFNHIIKEAVKNPKERFFVIVPEQFTMQTQKELVKLHPGHCLMNVDVLSFNRLAYRVFEETGMDRAPILEDTGKILVLQKILHEIGDDLVIFKKMFNKTGAAADINSLLSEFKQYNIDPEELSLMGGDSSALLKLKLSEIRLISEKFSEFMEGRYLTMEEVPAILSTQIEKYDALRSATVVFDGFTGFVPAQLSVIGKLLKVCRKVYVCATVDKKAGLRTDSSPSNLFNMTHRMVQGLIKAAADAGAEVIEDKWIEPGKDDRFKDNEALRFLEKKLFRYEFDSFDKEQDSIHLSQASSTAEEIENAAEIISHLVRDEGYRYRDFAFVSADMDRYGEAVRDAFTKNGIPCFLDRKQSIMSDNAVEFLRAAVDLAVEDFSYKSVFRFLKTSLLDIPYEDICLMENYVLANAVKGFSKYKKPWTRTCRTIEAEDLDRVNLMRQTVVGTLERFIDQFKVRNNTVKERTRALYELLEVCRVQYKCSELQRRFEAEGEIYKAREYSQIYKLIIDFLEKYVEIMGDEKVSGELYRQMLEAGLSDIKLGVIPANQDQVVIGDIERTRLKDIKVMFFAGLNEGIVPKPAGSAGILSESDRRELMNAGALLAPDSRMQMYRQRLYLYLNLTKPSQRLYLSYSTGSLSSEGLLPSYLVNVIRELFSALKTEQLSERDLIRRIQTDTGRQELLIRGFENINGEEPDDSFKELVSFYRQKPEGNAEVERLVSAVNARKADTNISRQAAESLYGKNREFSASRLESYGSCPFKHFLDYGLSLKERDVFEFSAADIGSMLHEAAKIFAEDIKKKDVSELTKDEIFAMSDKAFDRVCTDEDSSFKLSPSRPFDELRLRAINRLTAFGITQQVRAGSFRLFADEERFIVNGTKGVIDRVDVCETEDASYFRVIDYKSSDRDVDLHQFINGMQIQLPLYMVAAKKMIKSRTGKLSEPAGIYYYHMQDKLIEVGDMNEIVPDEKRLMQLRLTGISVDDPEVLKYQDEVLGEPKRKSTVINVSTNKDIDENGYPVIGKSARLLSEAEFKVLEEYTEHLLRKMRKGIEGGEAGIEPKLIGQNDSCAYCVYSSVCGYDEKIPGFFKKRDAGTKEDEEVIKDMIEELGGGDTESGD